jgi:hypothetical protein
MLPDSTTSTFNTDIDNINDGLLCYWFDGVPKIEVKEDVVALGSYGKTLTVFHTSEVTRLL